MAGAPATTDLSTPGYETGATTIPEMALRASEVHRGAALRFARDDRWTELSYAQLGTALREVAAGLASIGVGPGDRVAILAETSPEWTLADLAALCAGAVVAPIYQTSSPEESRYVLAHAGARVVVCGDAEQAAKVERVRRDCPDLEHVVVLSGTATPGAWGTLDDLRLAGRAGDLELADRLATSVSPDEAATIVYTSGTTGPPKGCVLTHANVMTTVGMYEHQLDLRGEPRPVVFMFLPLAHALARVTQDVVIDVGGTIAYWRGDPRRVLDDLADTRPTHLPAVPRVFEKVRTRALARAEDRGRAASATLRWALATGARARRGGGQAGLLTRVQHTVADRLVLSKVRALFGPDLRLALTGAAPMPADVLEFFDACGVLVLEGYGMTESTAAATLNTPGEVRFGTVGRALPGTGVRIEADGEVLLRGPNVFPGYYRDDASTAEVLDDGWLRTGDLGALDADGYLRITGRKKDLIITSSGKNISAANIEAGLGEIRWVGDAVVYGDDKPYLVALLTLDGDELAALADRAGVRAERAVIATDARVRAILQQEIDRVNDGFARIEQVKRFAILDRDFSQEQGELTPTLKVKRAAVHREYAEIFESLYD